MARIEAVAIVPGPTGEVWRTVVDYARWPEWFGTRDGGARLVRVEPSADPPDRVGAWRRCAAILPSRPLLRLLGGRETVWTEIVADVRAPWTLELEAPRVGRLLRRWRLRLTLVERPDGRTRVCCRLSYRPGSAPAWLVERLLVRRAITAAVDAALAGLAQSLGGDASDAVSQASPIPVAEHELAPDVSAASLAA